MPIPRDSHYERGNKNRVILSGGMRVTRGEAETVYARQLGFDSHREFKQHLKSLKAKKPGVYSSMWRDAKSNGFKKREFEQYIAQIDWSDNSPGGSKAAFLSSIGRRPSGADWNVGDTP